MSEKVMRRSVIKMLSPLDAIPVENKVGIGTPDVEGIGFWCELKKSLKWPVRPDTIVKLSHFSPQQRIWLDRRWRKGGVTCLLWKIGKTWLMFDGNVAAKHVGFLNQKELRSKACKIWETRIVARELISCIREMKNRVGDCG